MTMWDQVTDDERERLVTTIVGALPDSGVPHHLRAGLVRYFSDGILPGGFMQAVLVCDYDAARARYVGPGAAAVIARLTDFLAAHAPANTWGSVETVLAWTTTPDRLEIGSSETTDLIVGAGKAIARKIRTDIGAHLMRLAIGETLQRQVFFAALSQLVVEVFTVAPTTDTPDASERRAAFQEFVRVTTEDFDATLAHHARDRAEG
jgi:hypothetical protein